MKHTDNYSLKKPEPDDFYDVGDFNANADIVDGELRKRALRAAGAKKGNLAEFDGDGNPADSGVKIDDLRTADILFTVPAGTNSAWSGDGVTTAFTCEINVAGVKAGMKPWAEVLQSSVLSTAREQLKAFMLIDDMDALDGKIRVICLSKKPGVAVPCFLRHNGGGAA